MPYLRSLNERLYTFRFEKWVGCSKNRANLDIVKKWEKLQSQANVILKILIIDLP